MILGFAFGIGYYMASLLLKAEIMSDLMSEAKQIKFKKSGWVAKSWDKFK